MKRCYAFAALFSLAVTPLAAQRQVVVRVHAGGADHLSDLQKTPPAWFMPGYAVGASVGAQLSDRVSLHGDFIYTRNPVEGTGSLAGRDVNRFFYGIHAEYRLPLRHWAPFVFAGAGAVSIDQLGLDAFSPTTRPAFMYGGGVSYTIPTTRLELVGAIEGLTYKWNMAGFNRGMIDVVYTAGVAYRFSL